MDSDVDVMTGGPAAEDLTLARELRSLGPLDRIPLGEGRSYRVGGDEVAVFRLRDGSVFAVQARCPHRGGPLVDGLIGDGRVVCPLHGFAFELDSGAPLWIQCGALRTYPVRVTPAGELLIGTEGG